MIIRGRRLFQVFQSKGGDHSREAINRGTAINRGNTVCIMKHLFTKKQNYIVQSKELTRYNSGLTNRI